MITRRAMLEEALEIFSSRQRCFSKNLNKLEPKEGYEIAWEAEREKCDIVREMMRELMAGEKTNVSGTETGEGRETLPILRVGAGADSGTAISGADMGNGSDETDGYVQGSLFEYAMPGALYGTALFPDAGRSDGKLEQEDMNDDPELYEISGDGDGDIRPWQRDIMDRNGDLYGGPGSGAAGDPAEPGYDQMSQIRREYPARF